jgi:dipeptide/tripeptide permease
MSQAPDGWVGPQSNKQFMGHPVGLFVLFFTEMWERFSYYGMRGLLKIYMVNYLFITLRQGLQGGTYSVQGDPTQVLGWATIQKLLPALSDADKAKLATECIAPKVQALIAGDAAQRVAGLAPEMAQSIAEQTCAMNGWASVLYGWYTGLVYLTPVIGGLIADKYLGQKKSVFIGGTIMAAGQFVLFGSEAMFFVGLLLLIVGNGFFKPNISTQVGNLYPPGDARRDGAFTIFYMGINLGAFLCNFVTGTLAALYGWRYGFLAAGFGMLVGLLIQVFGQRYLAPDTAQASSKPGNEPGESTAAEKLTSEEWKRVWALVILCALNVVFWAVYEQQGNTMQTWADEQTQWPVMPMWLVLLCGAGFIGGLLSAVGAFVLVAFDVFETMSKGTLGKVMAAGGVLGAIIGLGGGAAYGLDVAGAFQVPSTWFQSANPFFIFLLAPLFEMVWASQARRGKEPSSVAKMAIGCVILGLSFIVMIVGAELVGTGKGSWFWPIFCTLLLTVGELYLSPIGLSLVTKVSPVRIVSLMMGMWFLSSFFGNILSGYIGQLYTVMPKSGFFTILLVLGVAAGIAIALFNKPLKKAMGQS